MSTLNPTLSGAVAKAERGIGFLKLPGATSDHLRQAMDCLKSAYKLAASHHTVLVELEDELPEPGPALFDETGAPAPGVTLGQPSGLGLRLEDHPVLTMGTEAYLEFNNRKRETLEEELLFAVRLHARARGLDYFALRDLIMDDLGGFDGETFSWVVEQITTCGDFDWPHKCEDCKCVESPQPDGTVLCWTCKRKREEAARAEAKQVEKKAAKEAAKKAKQAPRNPLEGGEE